MDLVLLLNQMALSLIDNFVNSLSIFGLILGMIGSVILIKPFILSNSAIQKIGEYKQPGTVWGQREKVELNPEIVKSFRESRDLSFQGISFLFVGFSLQLIQYFHQIVPLNSYNILLVSFGTLAIDYLILKKIKEKNEELRKK